MKILFFGVHFPRPNNQTIGTWALSQIVALRDAGHQVKVISPVPAIPVFITKVLRRGTSAVCPSSHTWNGIEVEYVRWPVYPVGPLAKWLRERPGLFVKLAWTLSKGKFLPIAKQFAPDVVFAHHGQLSGFVASEVARSLAVPFFITEHNFNDVESCAVSAPRRRLYSEATRGISNWIAVANRMRNAMTEIFPGVPAVTVHNGAELIPMDLRPNPRPPELSGRLVVLCVTFFYKRKNVPLLVESFDRIAARHPNAFLVIAGDGEDKSAVVGAAERAKHRTQIMLRGALGHREVLQHMLWCDVFAHIGVNEPFATVFSEAMMAGKPVIFSADGGITDVVVDGLHGLSALPGNGESAAAAMDRLLSDAALRTRLGSAAANLANTELTWAKNAENMAALFEAALRSKDTAIPLADITQLSTRSPSRLT
jgi:glycosyltransferase involved in cell wall biosynthesis